MDYIGKKVLIIGNHPHSGEEGIVTDYKEASALGKKGYVVEVGYGMSCYVFDERNLRIIHENKNRRRT